MARYRIYVLDDEDRVAAELEQGFPSEGAALICAEVARIGSYAVEVWRGDLLVRRLGGPLTLDFAT